MRAARHSRISSHSNTSRPCAGQRRDLAALLIGLALVAGCGSDDDGGAKATATPVATATAVPSSTSVPSTATQTATVPLTPTPTGTQTPTATATPTDGPSPLELLLSVPQTETWTLDGLSAAAQVVRTEADVPHMYAANRRDLALLQGFVMARDRYVMMELSRRLALGQLSGLLGDDALPFDIESRGMGMTRVAERVAAGFSPLHAEIADAFAAGINAYIGEVRAGNLPVPSEINAAGPLLGAENPADLMQPIDRRGVAGMIATIVYQTSFDSSDLERAAAAAVLDQLFEGAPLQVLRRQGALEDIFTAVGPTLPVSSTRGFGLEMGDVFTPGPAPPFLHASARRSALAALPDTHPAAALLTRLAGRLQGFEKRLGRDRNANPGSNAWAVAGSASTDGAALLAGDGHLQLSVPSIMYQLGLDTSVLGGGDTHQLGLTIPGLPLMIVGTNGRVAWSQTQLFGDGTDFYREAITLGADGLPAQSTFRGQQRALVRVDEQYVIADVPRLGSVGRTETVPRWTTFDGRWLVDIEGREVTLEQPAGPDEAVVQVSGRTVVPGDADADGVISGITLDYAGFDIGRMLDGPDGFGHSADVFEFREHTRALMAFSQNIAAADADGNIFYTVYQAVPCRHYLDRATGGEWTPGSNPLLVLNGTRYGGFEIPVTDGLPDEAAGQVDPQRCIVPFDSTPQAINPARGYVFTGNNDPGHIATDGSLSDDWYIGGPWDTGWRGNLIDEELAATAAAHDADVARMAAIQGNHESPLGRAFTPWLSEAITTARALSLSAGPLTPAQGRLVDLYLPAAAELDAVESALTGWGDRGFVAASGVETFYAAPPASEALDATATMIFNAAMARLVRGVWDDEDLPSGIFWRHDQSRVQLIRRFLTARDASDTNLASYNPDTGESVFFDVLDTPEVETSREVILGALVDALAYLSGPPATPGTGGFGTADMTQWSWGLRHQVRFESLLQQFLGEDPLFAIFTSLFSIDTKVLPLAPSFPPGDPRADLRWFPRPGDNWGIDAANPGFSGTDFTYADGPIMRMVIALKDGHVSGQNIIPGGQSGLTDSPHFADQAVHWLGNQTLPFRYHIADVVAGAGGREVYQPRAVP